MGLLVVIDLMDQLCDSDSPQYDIPLADTH